MSKTDDSHLILPRLFRLFEIFFRYPGIEFSHSQLAELTGYPRSTMTRLLQALKFHCSLGELVERKEGRNKYYKMLFLNQPRMPLNTDEAVSLSLSRDIASGILPDHFRDIAESAVSKSVATLLLNIQQQPEITLPVVQTRYMGNVDYSSIPGIKTTTDTILQCVKSKTVCLLRYHHLKKEEPTEPNHEIAPLGLQVHHDSIYLVAWEVAPKGTPRSIEPSPRHFALHRIKEISSTRRTHKLPQPPGDTFQYYGFPMHDPVTIRVHFTRGVDQFIKERLWSADQHIETLPDGSCILTFSTQSMREAFSKIMSFGIEATVLEPESLRERILQESLAVAERHRGKILKSE